MTKCYTFYSYKGGSGRSTTAVNTVKHLIPALKANKERPILIVDADLESAGLTYFFECENKFTDLFVEAIHTTKVFNNATSVLNDENGNVLFRVDNPEAFSPVSDKKTICENLKNRFPEKDIDSFLRGLELLSSETDMLSKIVKAPLQNDPSPDQKNIARIYKVEAFISNLERIERNSSLSDEAKAKAKLRSAREFLPASGFVDVSHRFGVEEGTVKFLGADVHYEGAQILNGENTVEAIRDLQELCNEHGYAAIVFDSGAGVQSSAAALQEASHVLVYCMRPTVQFRRGTRTQLANYKGILEDSLQLNKEDGEVSENAKIVILLPTAVPTHDTKGKVDSAFSGIKNIVSQFNTIVDGSFCEKETCLNEVDRFKWEESILDPESVLPEDTDEAHAIEVYRNLATKLAEFTEGDC